MIFHCNKIDATTPQYSKAHYEEIVKGVSSYLKRVRYNPNKIPFVPTSSFETCPYVQQTFVSREGHQIKRPLRSICGIGCRESIYILQGKKLSFNYKIKANEFKKSAYTECNSTQIVH